MSDETLGDSQVWIHPALIAGVTFALITAVMGIFAPVLASHDPLAVNLLARNAPPVWYADGAWTYILGTDHIGRDVLSRIIASLRLYLYIGFLGFLLGTLIAWILVVVRNTGGAAFALNMLRSILGISFHQLAAITFGFGGFLSIILVIIVGPSLLLIVVSVGAFTSLIPMTLVYGSVRGIGASSSPTQLAIRRGIALSPVSFSLALLMGLLIESILSFLRVGVPPPTPTLGAMIGTEQAYSTTAWWIAGFPLGIVLAAVGAFLAIAIPVARTQEAVRAAVQ